MFRWIFSKLVTVGIGFLLTKLFEKENKVEITEEYTGYDKTLDDSYPASDPPANY